MQVEAFQVRLPRPARGHGRRATLVPEPPHPRPRTRAPARGPSATRPCTEARGRRAPSSGDHRNSDTTPGLYTRNGSRCSRAQPSHRNRATAGASGLDTGRLKFAQDAVAFGIWAMAVRGLDNIEREQWRNVWPRIRAFTFESNPEVRTNGDTAWIGAGWRSA
jgi:hypothetical protein